MSRVGGDAGGIAIDRRGLMGWWHNSPDLAIATISDGSAGPEVRLNTKEDAQIHG